MMDADGAFRHWYYPGALSEQPAFDMQVYTVIKAVWIELRNAEIERQVRR